MGSNHNSRFSISKFIIYTSGIIGLGFVGAMLYKKKRQKSELSSLEKYNLTEELRTLFNTIYSFDDKLLNHDYEKINTLGIDSVFELESIQLALDLYNNSRDFKSAEIRHLIKIWFLNNVKMIEGYIGARDEKEILKSIRYLDLATRKVEKTIKRSGLYNELGEDNDIQEAIVGSYLVFKDALDSKNELAAYITDLQSKCDK